MKYENLIKGNEIKKEIDRLEKFISVAEKVWTGKIIKEKTRYIFKSSAYGYFKESSFYLDTKLKNKVLDVLRTELKELKLELEKL
ncbi:Uncharacterised protein [[Clostridium] sordellii]|uniref:hypothetical protein n=1 Tax=Paraclostridium sordellii TaxID=1505 RepID=UPI0005E934AF|nr:hypothetical protein [Paeniclostridium sordellii]CEP79270.1 Uncharacterised protein [[Clostridium] sordellii] [Paeniclostridium sordellii]